MERSCGILLPVYALPTPYGIGTLGEDSRAFVDFLARAGVAWWQMLPVGPTSFGDSPYQNPSTFAGNPYLIDLDTLVGEGLLEQDEIDALEWGANPAKVDYGLLFKNREPLLRRAYARLGAGRQQELDEFSQANAVWLADYSLFMALKRHFGMTSWIEWPDEDVRLRKPGALERYRQELADDVRFYQFEQMLFFRQWDALKRYAHSKGVRILGDLPIYVALDSADVWANPRFFQLDEKNVPTEVAGVPPDAFSAGGQLWGNPLYDYDAMEKDGFTWWIKRIGGASVLYDAIRFDHFRGLESYWAVPYGEETARNGRWVKGPGMKLVGALTARYPDVSFIAEDLGYTTPEVQELLRDSGMPGMKVLELGFDSHDVSDYMPHAYEKDCVCYTGTHDNPTVLGWLHDADPRDAELATRYFGLNNEEGLSWGVIRGGMSSVANLFVAQMQDFLELGSNARTNTPGTLGGNWQWRLLPGQITPSLTKRIAAMTHMYGRDVSRSWQKLF